MVNDQLRRSLHKRLDDLLDRRSALEVDATVNVLGQLEVHCATTALLVARSRPLVRDAAQLARDLVGDNLQDAAFRCGPEDQKRPREILKDWLGLVLPLLKQRPHFGFLKRQLTVYDVLDGLSALDAGEVQPLFKANTGKNRRANRWTLARTKLSALAWKKRLLAMGVPDKEASFRVTVAFQEQWETIRKWKSQCEEILGEDHVKWDLHFAGDETDPFIHPPQTRSGMFGSSRLDPDQALATAGANYVRERRRAAELSKRKGRGMNKPPLRPDQNADFTSVGIDGQ